MSSPLEPTTLLLVAGTNDLIELLDRLAGDAAREHDTLLSADESRTVSRQIETLQQGLESRMEIGQAKGILMERYRVTPDRAFEMLVTLSQHTNRKLVDICRELVETGALPADPSTPDAAR